MKKNFYLSCLLFTGLLCNVSCVDDNYDLDNIDKTSQIKVNNLTIPLNLSKVWMGDVLDVDDSDLIEIYTASDGKRLYAVVTDGSFEPNSVNIPTFEASTDDILLTIDNLSEESGGIMPLAGELNLPYTTANFTYESYDLDEAVNSVYKMTLSEPMEIQIEVKSSVSATITDLQVILPMEFEAYYNGNLIEGGLLHIPSVKLGETVKGITVHSINASDFEIEHNEDPSVPDFYYSGEVGINGGIVDLASISGPLDYIDFTFKMGKLEIGEIEGNITKYVDVPSFEGVDLGDLPDFLMEGKSSLELANPQLYLTLTDPIGANIQSNVSIIPMKDGQIIDEISQEFYLAGNSYPDTYTVVMAPNTSDALEYYDQAITFSNLGQILKGNGNGLPDYLDLNLQQVKVYGDCIIPLGSDINISGEYKFVAPLDLEGSVVRYEKTETDLFDNETDNIDIQLLRISADVETNIPFEITLSLIPLDGNGEALKDYISAPVTVKNGQSFDFKVENATGVRGVSFTATVEAESGALSPDQYIQLNNLKAQVSGSYITDF